MNYENIKKAEKTNVAADSVLFYTFLGFFCYFFWYQFAFTPIKYVPGLFGLIFLVFIIRRMAVLGFMFDRLKYYYVYLIYITVTSFLKNPLISVPPLEKIYNYAIPMLAIIYYIEYDSEKFIRVVKALFISLSILTLYFTIMTDMTISESVNRPEAIEGENALNINVLSSYMFVGLFCGSILVAKTHNVISSALIWFFLSLMAYDQLILASRRGLVSFVLYFIPFMLVYVKGLKNSIRVLLSIIVFVVVCFLSQTIVLEDLNVVDRFEKTGYVGDELRLYYSEIAWKLFQEKILTGHGLGFFANYAQMYSHSLYLETLSCLGIMGLIIIVFLIIGKSFATIYIIREKCPQNKIDILFLIFIIDILYCCAFVAYIYDLYFYIMLALILSYINVRKKELDQLDAPLKSYINNCEFEKCKLSI